jgi:3-oxoacyl-[acyl-carrier protein] reductase
MRGGSCTKEPIPNPDLDRLSEEFWHAILTTNLIGPFRCAKVAAGALRESRGAIVNTASVAGLNLVGSSMAYGASKPGLINLTKNLARGLAPEVRVNAVAPGFVDTEWTRSWPKETRQGAADRAVLKRFCTPQDIADVIVFL